MMNTSEISFIGSAPPLLVLVVEADGSHSLEELRRDDILALAREAIPPRATSLVGTLQPRDIRQFDPAFSNSHDPEILVRKHAVLINLDHIQALVLFNRCFIIVPDGADSVLGQILARLSEMKEFVLEFEFRSYEAVFVTVASLLYEGFRKLEPEIINSVEIVLKKTSGPILEELRQVERRLANLQASVNATRKAFSELLRSDRDMALMELSKVQMHPERYEEVHEEMWSFDHEDVELLVENYLQNVDSVHIGLRDLEEDLAAARSTTTLRLSSAQNKLLTVDLVISILTAVSTLGALVAALFGMNLKSGQENSDNWFWSVFVVVVAGAPLLVAIALCLIRRQSLLIS